MAVSPVTRENLSLTRYMVVREGMKKLVAAGCEARPTIGLILYGKATSILLSIFQTGDRSTSTFPRTFLESCIHRTFDSVTHSSPHSLRRGTSRHAEYGCVHYLYHIARCQFLNRHNQTTFNVTTKTTTNGEGHNIRDWN